MKKNLKTKRSGPQKPRKSQADKVRDIINPNVGGRAIRRQNQATQVAAKGEAYAAGKPRESRKKKGGIQFDDFYPNGGGDRRLSSWSKLVSNPFVGVNDVKCPMNFNPAPTLLSFRTTLVDTVSSTTKVTANYSRQLHFWPGHNVAAVPLPVVGTTGAAAGIDMDEVAYHARFQTISGTNYAVGPVNSYGGALAARSAAIGHFSADAVTAIGGVATTSVAGAAHVWDNPLPLTADPTQAGHMRWKMIAMGIRIRNITPVSLRGGSIVTVQPANVVNMASFANQEAFDSTPSFRIWGDGTDEVEVSWIPRTRDLAYWHQTVSTPSAGADLSATALEGPALIVWLNSATTTDQYYSYELFGHFEIAGFSVQTLSGQTHSMKSGPAVVQQALGAHLNNSATAHGINETISAAVGKGMAPVGAMARQGFSDVARFGVQAAVNAVKAAF